MTLAVPALSAMSQPRRVFFFVCFQKQAAVGDEIEKLRLRALELEQEKQRVRHAWREECTFCGWVTALLACSCMTSAARGS